MSKQKICSKRKIAYKKQNLEYNCVLQESCKPVRRWQISVLLVKGGHGVVLGDWGDFGYLHSVCTQIVSLGRMNYLVKTLG